MRDTWQNLQNVFPERSRHCAFSTWGKTGSLNPSRTPIVQGTKFSWPLWRSSLSTCRSRLGRRIFLCLRLANLIPINLIYVSEVLANFLIIVLVSCGVFSLCHFGKHRIQSFIIVKINFHYFAAVWYTTWNKSWMNHWLQTPMLLGANRCWYFSFSLHIVQFPYSLH